MAAYNTVFLTLYKHKEKMTCKNLGQYRYCLINGISNNVPTLQACVHQTKGILMYTPLKLK